MYRPGFGNTGMIVKNLIIINALFYVATYFVFRDKPLIENLSLYFPTSPNFRIWQPVTYMFMHGGFTHILFNMLGLWMFGTEIEYYLGPKRFLTYYMLCGLGAAALDTGIDAYRLFYTDADPYPILNYPMLGASGAVMGILAAYGLTFPNREMIMLFLPVPIKAKYMVLLFAIFELYMELRGGGNIAHLAHLGGMAMGAILILIWRQTGRM